MQHSPVLIHNLTSHRSASESMSELLNQFPEVRSGLVVAWQYLIFLLIILAKLVFDHFPGELLKFLFCDWVLSFKQSEIFSDNSVWIKQQGASYYYVFRAGGCGGARCVVFVGQ